MSLRNRQARGLVHPPPSHSWTTVHGLLFHRPSPQPSPYIEGGCNTLKTQLKSCSFSVKNSPFWMEPKHPCLQGPTSIPRILPHSAPPPLCSSHTSHLSSPPSGPQGPSLSYLDKFLSQASMCSLPPLSPSGLFSELSSKLCPFILSLSPWPPYTYCIIYFLDYWLPSPLEFKLHDDKEFIGLMYSHILVSTTMLDTW